MRVTISEDYGDGASERPSAARGCLDPASQAIDVQAPGLKARLEPGVGVRWPRACERTNIR